MEVKKGYKQTEIGVIPNDWEVETVINIASIKTGSKNTQDNIEDGLYPFFVRSQTVEGINTYSFNGEAVLTAGDGVGTGKVFHYINGKFDFHQRVYKISNFNDKINGYFFYLYFSNYFFQRISQLTAKTSVDSVRLEMIANMPIPVPPLSEQTAIATALSETDALITSIEKLIAKKRNIKQGAMQQLLSPNYDSFDFGDGRDAKKSNNHINQKNHSSDKWEVKKLGEICEIRKGQLITEDKAIGGNVPVIAGGKKPAYYHNKANRKNKTITISCSGASAGYVAFYETPIFASDCSTIEEGINYSIKFIFYQLQLLQEKIYKLQIGGAQPHIHPSVLKPLELYFPSKEEQTAIAQILSDMDAEIETLERKLEKYKLLKQGMMQELLTGKTRLV